MHLADYCYRNRFHYQVAGTIPDRLDWHSACCANHQYRAMGCCRHHVRLHYLRVDIVPDWRDAFPGTAMKPVSVIVYRKTKERLEREAREQQRLRDIENDPRRDAVYRGDERIYPLIEDE